MKAITTSRNDGWYFDNAALFHMIYSEAYFVEELISLENLISVETADGRILEATAVGNALLETLIENNDGEDEECMLTLANVYYVEGLFTNLLSLGMF